MSTNCLPAHWQGRIDQEQPAEQTTRLHQCIRHEPAPGWQLLGFACDVGVARNQGRSGAAAGPQAIRHAAASLAWPAGLCLTDHGDLPVEGDGLEAAQQAFGRRVAQALDYGPVLALGGGHETAWASGQGLLQWLKNHPGLRLGILNFDAHLDLRQPQGGQGSSGTPFYQLLQACQRQNQPVQYACLGLNRWANTALLHQRARDRGVWMVEDRHIREGRLNALRQRLRRWLATVDVLHLSIDLDVLPTWEAPGVSAPAAHGVPLALLEPLVQLAAASGKLKLADLAELNPQLDIDHRTARAAARLLAVLVQAQEGLLK